MHSLLGKVSDFGILELLQFLIELGASGKLYLEEGEKHAHFLLSKGHVLQGWRVGGTQIGELLLERNMIDKNILEEALVIQETSVPWVALGTILLRNGTIEPQTLETVLAVQIKDALHTALSWKHAIFSFDKRDLTRADTFAMSARINIQTREILFDVVRVQDELKRYLEPS